MGDSYICSGAMMRCTMGTTPARLTVLPARTVMLTGQPMANISDHLTMVNLAPFGLCRSLGFPATASATAAAQGALTPMPCMHNTPFPWMGGKMDCLIQNQPALLKSSKCQCMWGGTISIFFDGQTSIAASNVQQPQRDSYNNNSNSGSSGNNSDLSDGDFDELSTSSNNQAEISPEEIARNDYRNKIRGRRFSYNPELKDIVLAIDLRLLIKITNAMDKLSKGSADDCQSFIQDDFMPKLMRVMDIELASTPVEFYPGDENDAYGYYDHGDKQLKINSKYLNTSESENITEKKERIKILLNTIVHECKHARQFAAVEGKNYGYSKKLVEDWRENMKPGFYIDDDSDDEGYIKQPLELDAWSFAELTISDGVLSNAIKNRTIDPDIKTRLMYAISQL